MLGLIISILLFNFIAFKTNKRLSKNQIIHIWTFTIAFQVTFDVIVEFHYHAYEYFGKGFDWESLPAHTILLPPVNMMFLNWYPFTYTVFKRIRYFVYWTISILLYEVFTTLPEPWGYFKYGWWNLWHSAIVDPVLLFILLKYYKWIYSVENTNAT
ncbi:hypothetical protein [Neobacillus cucumis]|uniref:hypothetical protein n=1 Tax=Neobacillus cucumis TaxID=1740721 RepID=UPI002E227D7C|nr:hypothetical protein [Neobacillus cucumis]